MDCKYIQDKDSTAPYPRAEYKTECGINVVIVEGYKVDEDGYPTSYLNQKDGICMNCRNYIKY